MVEQAGVGHAGGEVGGIGQGGELIADISTGDDHTGGHGGVDAQARADAEHRDTDGGGGSPGRAAGKAHDGAQAAADRQEQFRGQQVQTVVDQGGNGAGHHEGRNQKTDRHEDQQCLERVVQTIEHAGEHVGEAVAAQRTNDAGDAHRNDQRHVGVNIVAAVQAVDHEACHHDDGQQRLKDIRESNFLFVCHKNLSLLQRFVVGRRRAAGFYTDRRCASATRGKTSQLLLHRGFHPRRTKIWPTVRANGSHTQAVFRAARAPLVYTKGKIHQCTTNIAHDFVKINK